MSGKITGREQLQRIADALDDDILNASSAQLREELAAEGLEERKVIAEMDAILEEAKKFAGRVLLERAKEAVSSRASVTLNVKNVDRERVRRKLDAMRSGAGEDVAGMMIAARKGQKLSEHDEEGILNDLAQLGALENEGDNEE